METTMETSYKFYKQERSRQEASRNKVLKGRVSLLVIYLQLNRYIKISWCVYVWTSVTELRCSVGETRHPDLVQMLFTSDSPLIRDTLFRL